MESTVSTLKANKCWKTCQSLSCRRHESDIRLLWFLAPQTLERETIPCSMRLSAPIFSVKCTNLRIPLSITPQRYFESWPSLRNTIQMGETYHRTLILPLSRGLLQDYLRGAMKSVNPEYDTFHFKS